MFSTSSKGLILYRMLWVWDMFGFRRYGLGIRMSGLENNFADIRNSDLTSVILVLVKIHLKYLRQSLIWHANMEGILTTGLHLRPYCCKYLNPQLIIAIHRGIWGGAFEPPPQSITRSSSTRSCHHAGLVAAGRIQAVLTYWRRNFRGLGIFTEKNIAECL